MTNDVFSADTQRRIDEIEKILVQTKPLCEQHLAGCPRPEGRAAQMCRMKELENELKRLKGL
jgi:hypothetical protein